MAKFYGPIGFAEEIEVRPGYFKNQITPYNYRGDVIRDTRRYQASDKVNDDIRIDNQISIVADSRANDNIRCMKWIQFGGTKWKISSVEVKRPRLIISMGDVWNENSN